MSNKYKNSSDVPLEVLINRLNELAESVVDNNAGQFTMRIPAEVDRDADLVLSEAAIRIDQLHRQNDELVARVARLESGLVDCSRALLEYTAEDSEVYFSILRENPAQSPQHIEAAILKKHCKEDCYENLRQQNGSDGDE